MIIIQHRRNLISQLKETPVEHGVEIDLRSHGSDLILHHDPFTEAVTLEEWLNHFSHAFLILNVKEDGLEARIQKLLEQRGIQEYCFLDQAFPTLIKTIHSCERRTALRISEYEPIESILPFGGKASFVWVDSFHQFWLSQSDASRLKEAGFKLIMVSPELQGRFDHTEIENIKSARIPFDAVCTKEPELWHSR